MKTRRFNADLFEYNATEDNFVGFDCNTNEVYENDIVRFERCLGEILIGTVISHNQVKVSNRIIDNVPFRFTQVIGNIYQNPELLE